MMIGKKAGKPKRDAREWARLGALAALLLAAAGLLVFRDGTSLSRFKARPEPIGTSAPITTAPPEDARNARELAYDKDIATLEALVGNENTDEQTRAQAGERLARMVSDHQCEVGVETALRQAGFRPCLVLMQNGSLTVMVSEHELSGTQSVTILSVCVAHADVDVENVRIMTGQEV